MKVWDDDWQIVEMFTILRYTITIAVGTMNRNF